MPPTSFRLTFSVTPEELTALRQRAATSALGVTAYARALLGLRPVQRGGARPGSGRPKGKGKAVGVAAVSSGSGGGV
jgi:hypothetical protein